jgi:LmbE family N-acetylglucosaminyl deacetylase
MIRLRTLLASLLFASGVVAQAPPLPVSGAAGLELMMRKLGHTGVVMMVNAHPDDENNALIAYLAHGLGARVVEVTATRGEGGQNDLGFEMGHALSVLRTEELLSAHRLDGAEQLFARAIDFGYSFSVEETFAKWGKEEILADLVHHIRAVRPDVIITMTPDGGGGGQHHQASARLAREAFDKAADPNAFPEQLKQGLHPWQATRLYVPLAAPPPADEMAASRRSDPQGAESQPSESRAASRAAASRPESRPGDVAIELDKFDAALGCTYAEQGARARSMHKSQGMQRLLALPGSNVARFRIAAGSQPRTEDGTPTEGLFSGIQVQHWLVLGSVIEPQQHHESFSRAEAGHYLNLEMSHGEAFAALREGGPSAAVGPLSRALRATQKLRAWLKEKRQNDPEAARVDRILELKEQQFQEAIALAAGLRIEAIADDGVVTPGQEVKVTVYVANRLASGVDFVNVGFEGFDPNEGGCATRPSGVLAPGALVKCESKLRIPKDARPTSAHWKPVAGTCRSDFEPDVPFGAPFRPTPFRARVRMTGHGFVPIVFEVPVEFRDGSDVFAGEKRHELLVVAAEGPNAEYQRIEYPHVRRRHLVNPTTCKRPEFELKLGAAQVGWVRGVGDHLDEAIRCFGTTAEPIDEGVIKSGRLDRYPAVVIGSRAVELRPEIRACAKSLREYAEKGGTLIILYQRSGLDEGTLAPYPGKTGGGRVTDENAPVKVLVPDHPVFNTPNKLAAEDWSGWVQERGRSFFETKDARYVDLIEMEDPFEFNKGSKRGALVEARVGKGRWIYVGLVLSRQLDEGVPGAYRLLANLLSLRGDP